MDQISFLRDRVHQSRLRQQRQQFLIIALLAAVIGGWLWYSCVYSHTPEFALKQLQQSAEAHDAEKFKKYINANLLVSTAYDDLTIDLFDYDEALSESSKAMFKRFYILIRPQLVQGTADLICRRVATGQWLMPGGGDILKGNQLGIDYEWFIEASLLRSTEAGKIKNLIVEGRTATAELDVTNKLTGRPFTLRLALEPTAEGHWQVISVTNYRTYLTENLPLISRDTSACIRDTQSVISAYNSSFMSLRSTFRQMTKKARGTFNPQEQQAFKALIGDKLIPLLKARQAELDAIPAAPGAAYFVALRRQSTETTIAAWQHFLAGILSGNPADFNRAEELHKQEMELDRRIEAIIEHSTINQDMQNLQ